MDDQAPAADPEELVLLAADAARVVLESGGETYRAEETAAALCAALGGAEAECFATPTCVILSTAAADGRLRSAVRRVRSRSMDLERVARVDELVRSLAGGAVDMDGAALELGRIESQAGRRRPVALAAAAVGTGFFALLFGGRWNDALVAAAVGCVISLFAPALARRALPDFFINLVGGAVASLLCAAAARAGLASGADAAAIGAIMLLVPGVAITNAIRDTIHGDLVSGVARAADAFMSAAAISIGSGGVGLLWRAAPAAAAAAGGAAAPGILWSGLAAAGFALLFNVRGRDLPLAAAGASLGWAAYLALSAASGAQAIGYLGAAAAIGLWAEILAAARRKPATVYMICGILPLVPGGGMYYTMLQYVQGESWLALNTGFAAVQAAGAIAAGLALASAASRLLSLRSLARRRAARGER